jgi:hypothetical protein
MRTRFTRLALLAVAVAGIALQAAARADEPKPDAGPTWEYRVLTRDEVIDQGGKKDLAAGLNKLGAEGWELAAVDTVYIFKRSRDRSARTAAALRNQIPLLISDLELMQDRVSWAERMVRKGYMTDQQLQAERAALKMAELALERARQELKALTGEPKGPPEKAPKPGF